MHTSLLLVVLAGGLTAGADAGSLNWATDYAQAKKQAKEAGKPLAIFLNEGDAAAAKLLTDGNLSGTTQQLLSSDYVALFINTATPAGKDLAGKFDLPGGKGIVVSDRSGVYQALRHEGETSNSQLETYLKKYADPTFVVRTTDSNTTARTSFYQGNGQYVPVTGAPVIGAPVAEGAPAPVYYAPGNAWVPASPAIISGGSCPSCSGGYRR